MVSHLTCDLTSKHMFSTVLAHDCFTLTLTPGVCLSTSQLGVLDFIFRQFTFFLKITATQKVKVVVFDCVIQWSWVAYARKSHWFLIKEELEPEAICALVQDKEQVCCVRQYLAAAELSTVLHKEVLGR